MIRENGGFKNFRMIEVEKYSCGDKWEVDKRETEIMKELKSNLNSVKSYITEEERKETKQKCDKEYYYKNYEIDNEKSRIYRELNKDKIKDLKKSV